MLPQEATSGIHHNRLPNLKLPCFDSDLSNIDKFNYLLNCTVAQLLTSAIQTSASALQNAHTCE